MDFAITGKKIKGTAQIQPQITTPKPTPKKPANSKPVHPVYKPKPPITNTKVQPAKPKKSAPVKQQQKKEEPKPVEQKKEQKVEVKEKKQEVIQEPPKQEPKEEQIIGEVVVRYNHYKQKFPTKNSVLSFVPIEQKYSFSDLFKGNFIPVIKTFRGMEQIQPKTTGKAIEFSWQVEGDKQYRLQIQQDDQEEAKYEKKVYKAPTENKCPLKRNMRAQELTAEMKKMSHDQYGSEAHKALLEQRDLEDVLFS